MRPLKLNPDYAASKHLWREIPYTISTILCGTIYEVVIIHFYATGKLTNIYWNIEDHQLRTLIWIASMPFWRDGHFYFVHRAMHRWNTTTIPDVGEWLYKVAHSLHHKSKNFEPWSGISMHPIEGIMYESATLIPLFFFHHPLVIHVIKIDLTLSAVLGHDGYDFPGAGDWYHLIHHTKTNCNYGSPNAPFDVLFGSVDYGTEEEIAELKLKAEKI
jgi:sterol desaturase/sphingolipid hydroxylase (fatty acid hydroxylase superfamily)